MSEVLLSKSFPQVAYQEDSTNDGEQRAPLTPILRADQVALEALSELLLSICLPGFTSGSLV